MAREMGSDRDALLNQALHVFARLNGYLVPGAVAGTPPPVPAGTERRAVAERVLETAARLEQDILAPPPVPDVAAPALFLEREDGSEEEVAKDRFLVGRGPHCDLVVESSKVSREHAAFVRENGAWFIEDLGSSNGTWYRRERITRRRLEDGDEIFVCAERIRCHLR
jgi:hypothetical protein